MDIRTDADGWAIEEPTAEQVRQIRADLGWSAQKAANFVHISQPTWSQYDRGVTQMPLGLWNLFLTKTGHIRPSAKEIPILRQLDMPFRPKKEDVIKLRGRMTQTEIAEVFGISYQQWQQWELGTRNIKPWQFEYFAFRLGRLRDFPHLFGDWN